LNSFISFSISSDAAADPPGLLIRRRIALTESSSPISFKTFLICRAETVPSERDVRPCDSSDSTISPSTLIKAIVSCVSLEPEMMDASVV
jgi:hypothetical protein